MFLPNFWHVEILWTIWTWHLLILVYRELFFLGGNKPLQQRGGQGRTKKTTVLWYVREKWMMLVLFAVCSAIRLFQAFCQWDVSCNPQITKKVGKNAHQNSNISHIHNSMKMNKMSVVQWCVRSILLPKTFKLIWHRLATPNTKYLNLLKTKHRGRKNVVKIRKKMKN